MRIVVIGGQGNFGARICRALAADSKFEVIATSRRVSAARAPNKTDIAAAQLDLDHPEFAALLAQLKPRLVIHCAGPFQGQDYRVAEAAITAGSHYIDIADGRDFVCNFVSRIDAMARIAGVLAITGASSVPGLSAAVVDHLATRLRTVRAIDICIAPAQQAQRGVATIAGVFSYAGRPLQWLENGQWRTVYGWQSLRRLRFRTLGTRLAAACDVPDLTLFPQRYPGVQTVRFHAALELAVEHLALWLCAALRRAGLPLPLERWAAPLDRVATALNRLGSRRGGMLVSVAGEDAGGQPAQFEWELTAENNHGPEIPCMAAILLARRMATGSLAASGGHPCVGLLGLEDFAPEFARWGMLTRIDGRTG